MTDYSFTLQAIIELQKTVAQLTERINTLVSRSEKQGDKLDSISHQIYAAWAAFIVLGAVGAFLAQHLWTPFMTILQRALAAH